LTTSHITKRREIYAVDFYNTDPVLRIHPSIEAITYHDIAFD